MGRSWTWFVGALVCLSCSASPSPGAKATVSVASAPSTAASRPHVPKRGASSIVKRYWTVGVRPQTVVYADLQGLVQTALFRLLLDGFLNEPERKIDLRERDCIRDAMSSVRELAFGSDGNERLVIVSFEPSAMRTPPADCLSNVMSFRPEGTLELVGIKVYTVAGGEYLVIRNDVLLYGTPNSVIQALRPDRAEVPWPQGLELSAEQYLAFNLTNPNPEGSPYTQIISDGSGGLLMNANRIRFETRLEFFDEERAAGLEGDVKRSLDVMRSNASFPRGAGVPESITVERDGRKLIGAIEISGTASEQAHKLGLIAGVTAHGVRKYLRSAKQTEARMTIAEIAEAYATSWQAAPVGSNKGKLWSLPAIPKTIPSGTRYQSSPDEWKGWQKIGFSLGEGQYYQYEVIAAANGSSAEVIARGDLDGNGKASRFSLRLELERGKLTISPAIEEKDPDE